MIKVFRFFGEVDFDNNIGVNSEERMKMMHPHTVVA